MRFRHTSFSRAQYRSAALNPERSPSKITKLGYPQRCLQGGFAAGLLFDRRAISRPWLLPAFDSGSKFPQGFRIGLLRPALTIGN